MQQNNQGFNNPNFQNNNYNMNNMNMNMNYLMQNELLKCVMEGMGEQPKNTYKENMDFIMNYVPINNNDTNYISGPGNPITISFRSMRGGITTKFRVGDETSLNRIFQEYGRRNNINNVNNLVFIGQGGHFSLNNLDPNQTPKSLNFKDNIQIIVNEQ